MGNTRNIVSGPTLWPGLLMVTLSTLMYEMLLTRIFSVTMWYHFAFVAVSVAMFGMTIGALIVYLLPAYYSQARALYQLTVNALLFAISIVISFLTHLSIPFRPDLSLIGLYSVALVYTVLTIPFIFSGICVCLALTKYPHRVSRLYAADLAGAAIGCIALVYTLDLTDGPTAVIFVASLAASGAALFAYEAISERLKKITLACCLLFAGFAAINTVLANNQQSLLRLVWVRGNMETPPLYEKWNSFSRIAIARPDNAEGGKLAGTGLHPSHEFHGGGKQLQLSIDAWASTPMISFDSDADIELLKYSVINAAHYLKNNAKVLVIGAGGGRDVLSALLFGQQSVVAVELNNNILEAVNLQYGDFTRHLDRNPKVMFVHDEARSYVARQQEKFDIIHVSLIDTYAATAAGAFVLSENSLYTVEAWEVFLEHLNPDGILTFSRWYRPQNMGELYRLTSLAVASLTRLGIEHPRKHIAIVRSVATGPDELGVGTILIRRTPFSDEDLTVLGEANRKMLSDVMLSPQASSDETSAKIASGKNLSEVVTAFPLDIAPPTDDKPFFFQMLRFQDMFKLEIWRTGYLKHVGDINHNLKGMFVLGALLLIVNGLTFIFIIMPLLAMTNRNPFRGAWPLIVFFFCIGFGFMFIEISQMQRLIVFLGHPTYSLSVVLFSLLTFSGLGSSMTQHIIGPELIRGAMVRLLLMIGVVIIFGTLTPYAITAFEASTTPVRMLVASGLLLPLGLFMGMAFPLGMKLAFMNRPLLTPWLWGINGAASVCASVLAVTISLMNGISMTYWAGAACYVAATAAFAWSSRSLKPTSS